jgi:decaprenylphospho-beta-D-ribofuranose 2-oxidase
VAESLLETATFVSFDGGVAERAAHQRPDRYRMIEGDRSDNPRIARGGGYSYAAASFGGGSRVVDMTRFDRVLRFGPATQLIEVEAGMTVGDLLSLTVPHGLWLPAQPGYPRITIGGCIAANVHGKSPVRDGAFVHGVADLTLFHPRHGTLRVDREKAPELFELTCGGYGLTGIILSATLRLAPLRGTTLSLRRSAVGSLAEGLERLRTAPGSPLFTYTWHDGTPKPGAFGRGFVFEGTLQGGGPPAWSPPRYRPLTAASRQRVSLPIWGQRTAPLLAAGYRWLERRQPEVTDPSLFDAMFPFARRSTYFRLFGRRGLAEAQLLIPNSAIEGFLAELQQRLLSTRAPVALLSMKRFAGTQTLLRFEGDGVCVTLDLPRSRAAGDLLSHLDELTIAAHGLPHLIKDSRLPRRVVRACYPEYEAFRARLLAHDPDRIFRSELSTRLAL